MQPEPIEPYDPPAEEAGGGRLGALLEFRDRPRHERPRERLAFYGAEQLRDDELVALVFGSGGALGVAQALLDLTGGVPGLRRVGLQELCRLRGIGAARASQLKAALELGRRALLPEPLDGLLVRGAADLAPALQIELAHGEQEAIHVFGLDARHRVRCRHIAALGQVDRVLVSAADVFRPLLREGLASAIVAHNHPSGEARPSVEDEHLTLRLAQAGHILGITLLDHLVVASGGYYSFAEHGLLESVFALPPARRPSL
jgi:DNA repair protein RadC